MKRRVSGWAVGTGIGAVAFGALVAWVDTRPTWDDAGITAGALALAAGIAAGLGLRWWAAALLVALPIITVEARSAGWPILLVAGFTACGAVVGALAHQALRGPNELPSQPGRLR